MMRSDRKRELARIECILEKAGKRRHTEKSWNKAEKSTLKKGRSDADKILAGWKIRWDKVYLNAKKQADKETDPRKAEQSEHVF